MIYYDEKEKIGKETVIIKEFKRVRDLDQNFAFKLHVISKFLEKPVLVKVKEEVKGIHYRYGIPIINSKKIEIFKKGQAFFVYKGGIFYKIDPEKLLEKLKEKNLSISEFCRKVGISKRNFYNYLNGQMVSEETYKKIEELLGDIREKNVRKLLNIRNVNITIEIDSHKEKIYNFLKKRFETYALCNKYVDFCVKGEKRMVIKIGNIKSDFIEIAAKELESEPIVIKNERELKDLVMNY